MALEEHLESYQIKDIVFEIYIDKLKEKMLFKRKELIIGEERKKTHTFGQNPIDNQEEFLKILTDIVNKFIHYEIVEWAIKGSQWLEKPKVLPYLFNIIQNNKHGIYREIAIEFLVEANRDKTLSKEISANYLDLIKQIALEDDEDIVRLKTSNFYYVLTNNKTTVFIPTAIEIMSNSLIDIAQERAFWQLYNSNVQIADLKKNYNNVRNECNKFWFALLLFIKGESGYEKILSDFIQQKKTTEYQINFWKNYASKFGLTNIILTQQGIKTKIKNLEEKIRAIESNVKNRPLYKEESDQILVLYKEVLNDFIKIHNRFPFDFLKQKFEILNQMETEKPKDIEKYRREKGKILEEFCKLFFTQTNDFIIEDTNVRFKNEEIDIILKNKSSDPYWQKFSQYIFIECKNWTEKIGKNEIVIFKNNLENHQNITNVGFLISFNGFTDGVSIENIRAQLKGYTIGLIEKKHFVEFFDSNIGLLEFLEGRIFKSIK